VPQQKIDKVFAQPTAQPIHLPIKTKLDVFFTLADNIRFSLARSYYCESAESIYKEIMQEIELVQEANDFSIADGRLADFYCAYNERYPNVEGDDVHDDTAVVGDDVETAGYAEVDGVDDPSALFDLGAESD